MRGGEEKVKDLGSGILGYYRNNNEIDFEFMRIDL